MPKINQVKKKYIYILSQRYSGSTLLSFLLGTHPGISTIGERRKFYIKSIRTKENEIQTCSCGKKFVDCEYWSAIRDRLLKRVEEGDLKTNATEFRFYNNRKKHILADKLYQSALLNGFPKSLQPFSDKMQQMLRVNRILTEEILDLDGNKAFLDSSKIIDQALYLSQMEEFDFYVIWLSRDPRAQVNSAVKYHKWSISDATEKWKSEMKNNAYILDKQNINYTHLRYEDLCREPEKEMRRILDFCGLNSDTFSLDFRSQTQHIMGNGYMRLGKETKIEERKDWQEKLSKEDVKLIEKLTVDYQKYYSV